MKREFIGFLIASAMLAAPQVMTNYTVEVMVSGGVPLQTIVSAIRGAVRIQLSESKQDYDRLIAAGSSLASAAEIMKAIRYRQFVGIDTKPVLGRNTGSCRAGGRGEGCPDRFKHSG